MAFQISGYAWDVHKGISGSLWDCQIQYKYYLQYFNDHFGFSFGRPQLDMCCTCESLSVKLKDPELSDAAELMIHKRRAKQFYSKMEEAEQNDSDTAVLSFDYMHNLPLPNIPVQEVFYLRELWCFAFCIHNVKTNRA
ncbi:hypothetical protein C0J52_21526 [Blattella germanica]|nr:hypothetical protein C0J52_21526 [Blattella germanica]